MFTYFIISNALLNALGWDLENTLSNLHKALDTRVEYCPLGYPRPDGNGHYTVVMAHGDVANRVTDLELYNPFAQASSLFVEGMPVWVTEGVVCASRFTWQTCGEAHLG